jgi:hypothetical protein
LGNIDIDGKITEINLAEIMRSVNKRPCDGEQ